MRKLRDAMFAVDLAHPERTIETLDRKVRAAGGESHLEVWPEMLHVWHIQTGSLPQAHDALQRAGEFLIGHLEK